MDGRVRTYENRLEALNMRLKACAPERRLLDNRQYLDALRTRLDSCIDRIIENGRHRLRLSAAKLSALSPLAKISGGFGYLEDEQGHAVRTIDDVECGRLIRVRMSDGSFHAEVSDKEKN